LLPPKSPNLNAQIERFMRSMKSECLERMVFFGERSLRRALAEFVAHYHGERNHQGLGDNLIEPDENVGSTSGKVTRRDRLGGMLRYYYRDAAREIPHFLPCGHPSDRARSASWANGSRIVALRGLESGSRSGLRSTLINLIAESLSVG